MCHGRVVYEGRRQQMGKYLYWDPKTAMLQTGDIACNATTQPMENVNPYHGFLLQH
jgi:hypothetical protein